MEKSCSSNSSAVADDDDLSSSTEVEPDWSNFYILVEVAEVERIKLEKEKKEAKLRQNLSTSLKLLDEQETEDSIKNPNIDEKEREESVKNSNSNGVAKLQIPVDQDSAITKGKRSLGEKRSSTETSLCKNFSKIPPLLELVDGKHREEDGSGNNNNGDILISFGTVVKKPSKRLRCNEKNTHQEEIKPRPKKVKITNNNLAGPSIMHTTIAIPERFENRILELGGSESSIVFVFQKVLTKTDVNPHHRRLLIPFKQLKNEFLTDEEKNGFQTLKQQYQIDAVFIEPSLDDCTIKLKEWDMKKDKCGTVSRNYSLIAHWTDVVRRNQLREGMTVQLWAFRKGSQLGLALVLVN